MLKAPKLFIARRSVSAAWYAEFLRPYYQPSNRGDKLVHIQMARGVRRNVRSTVRASNDFTVRRTPAARIARPRCFRCSNDLTVLCGVISTTSITPVPGRSTEKMIGADFSLASAGAPKNVGDDSMGPVPFEAGNLTLTRTACVRMNVVKVMCF